MAYSYSDFGAKSPGDTITVGFPFRSRDHVSIEVDGVPVAGSTWSWVNDGLVECVSAFPTGGRIKRTTPDDELEGTLVGTAVLDYPTINNNNEHLLFVLQEKADQEADREARLGAVEQDLEDQQGNLDATAELSRKWAEEAENVAVTPGHYSSLHHAAKSQQSATASSNSASTASTMATNSATARTGSETARDLSQKWASESEDVVVSGGLYSALHYAAKAAASLAAIVNGMAGWIHGATSKATPVNNDELALSDSEDGWSLKKFSIGNLLNLLRVTPWVPEGTSSTSADLNTVTTPGWSARLYRGVNANSPGGGTNDWWSLFVIKSSSTGDLTQIAVPYTVVTSGSYPANGMWIRTYFAVTTTWSSWRKMAYADEVLALIGGTLTGKLTLDGNPSSALHATPKQYVDGQDIGIGQTWQSVTRSVATSYQNTTGKPIMVNVSANGSSAAGNLQVSPDNSTWVTVGLIYSNAQDVRAAEAVVPAGHYYKLTAGTATWVELR